MSTSLFDQYKAALRRGHLAALAGELDAALLAYDEAGRLVPDRPLPVASRATVLHRLDRWPEAAAAFDQALQLAPDDEAALRARATARADRGLRSGAAADFERLAFVLDVAGRSADAASAARRAADLEPNASRAALAERLETAAGQLVELRPSRGEPARDPASAAMAGDEAVAGDEAMVEDLAAADPEGPGAAAAGLAASEPAAGDEGLEAAWAAMAERATLAPAPHDPAPQPDAERHVDLGAYDALDALRVGLAAEERAAAKERAAASERAAGQPSEAAVAAAVDEAAASGADGAQPDGAAEVADEAGAADSTASDGEGRWPGIDLPSPPPPPIEGRLDPEELLAEAALVLESGEVEAARDLMLTAARVHREAGRIDPALEICLNLLSIAPGDPRVHLAIANLQLDRGWTPVATEKLDLLVRLTSLTGDTQAEADVHGLASERLRDDPAAFAAGR